MEKELENLEIQELNDFYLVVKDFIGYLGQQTEETEKMREEKWAN